MAAGTLSGIRIVVTRARSQAGKLATMLEARGAVVFEFPTIEIRCVPIPRSAEPLESFSWIVFTSANAVECLARNLGALGRSMREAAGAEICAVGPATRAAVESHGLSVKLLPHKFNAEGVAAIFRAIGGLSGNRVLFPRGDIARPDLPRALRALGAVVEEWTVYETTCPDVPPDAITRMVEAKPDVITFTSASTARNFAAILGESLLALPRHRAFASIGPETTAAARAAGLEVAIEPATHDVPSLVSAIEDWAARR